MQVNSEIWGASSTWETYDVSPITVAIFGGKLPVFDSSKTQGNIDRYDVKSAIDAGKLSTARPIDVSPCPWRIRGDSYFLGDYHKIAILPGTSGARYTFKTSPVYDERTRTTGAPVALTWGNAPAITPKMLNYKFIWGDSFDVSSPMYAGDWSPLLDFNYQKLCVVPYVVAYDSNQSQSVKIPLSTYIANGGVSRYRYIQGLAPKYYVGGAGAWVGTTGMLRLRPFGATVDGFSVTGRTEYDEPFLTYGDGVTSDDVPGSTQSNGYTDFSGSAEQNTEAESYAAQLTNNNTIFYRSIPEGWYITDRGAGACITEYDNRNEDFDVDWIIEQFLTLGLWVYTGSNILDFDPENPNEYAYAPIFDEYGTTTGRGAKGAAALETPAGTWTNNVQGENVYNGDEPPFDPTNYDDENKTIFSDLTVSASTQNAYVVNDFYDVMNYFYLENWNVNDAIDIVKKFANVSPIDCVQSYMLFPFRIVSRTGLIDPAVYKQSELTTENVKFANVTSNAVAWKLPEQSVIIDLGYIDAARYFGDFRDFEPYTSLLLYIPFCGFIQLDCSTFMGKKIKIKYVVDWFSGSCTACIMADNLVVQTANGQIGIQIPLTGTQSAQLRNAIDSAQLQFKQAQTSTVATIAALSVGAAATVATGGTAAPVLAGIGATAGVMANAVKASEKLDYQLQHVTTPFKTVGGSTPANAAKIELTPRLIISRPKMLKGYNAEIFGKTNGFACIKTGYLSEFSGFTQCAAVNLDGITATAEEKTALNALLLKGVIL